MLPRNPLSGVAFKRSGHRNYYRYKRLLNTIFTEKFPGWSTQTGKDIINYTGIPTSTLYHWRKKWEEDPNWRPWSGKNHGIHHRIFTEEEETSISDFILENYLVQGRVFSNGDFKAIISDAYLEKYKNSENIPPFNVSDGFISDFKKRNNFTTRKPHVKRRPDRDPQKEEEFLKRVRNLLENVDHDRILNCDETFWRSLPCNIKTWGIKGSANVNVYVNGDDKEGVTVLACITASRTKLPLWIIAEGKTKVCHKQLGDVPCHNVTHSEKGWTTTDTFSEFLMSLRERYPDEDPIYLILDVYPVHKEE